jgi:hypothetical protein
MEEGQEKTGCKGKLLAGAKKLLIAIAVLAIQFVCLAVLDAVFPGEAQTITAAFALTIPFFCIAYAIFVLPLKKMPLGATIACYFCSILLTGLLLFHPVPIGVIYLLVAPCVSAFSCVILFQCVSYLQGWLSRRPASS